MRIAIVCNGRSGSTSLTYFINCCLLFENKKHSLFFEPFNYRNLDKEKKIKRIEHLIQKYRTIWEVSQRELIDMAADRAPFIDQSQSMNVYFQAPTVQKLSSSHFWAWKRGLKSLSYYVRTKAISTGAKHLAINVSATESAISAMVKPEPAQIQEVTKPENSQFDCFGCSS